MPQADRLKLLAAAADGIRRRFDDFLAAKFDTGKPVSWASKIDIPRGAANLQLFADLAKYPQRDYVSDTPDGGKALNYAVRQPLGVVGIRPWNLPLLLMTGRWGRR